MKRREFIVGIGAAVLPLGAHAQQSMPLIGFLAARLRLPAIYYFQVFAARGGLVAYGPDIAELYRGGATYVDRILRGAKPGELPVQLPTKYQLVINLKTAKALGITGLPPLLARADEIIE